MISRLFAAILPLLALASPALADEPSGHRVLGNDKGKVVILGPQGKVEWEYPCHYSTHELVRLPNGNIMFESGPATVVEVTPEKEVVWKYTGKPRAPYTGPVEIHAFQRLENGLTMLAETGNKRLIEVDRDGNIQTEIALRVDHPHPHTDTRQAHKLANGHYLVCHEADGCLREYDATGKIVWTYNLDLAGRPAKGGHDGHGTSVFSALRKPNGNTLIGCGNGNRVIEVTPEGKTVWSVEHDELPGITLFWVTTVAIRPNGNIVFGNCHARPKNPQLIEITPDKKVVWTLHDWKTFGNDLACARVLD